MMTPTRVRAQRLRHACKVTLAVTATCALAQWLGLQLVLWSVLTTVVVMRLTAGQW